MLPISLLPPKRVYVIESIELDHAAESAEPNYVNTLEQPSQTVIRELLLVVRGGILLR